MAESRKKKPGQQDPQGRDQTDEERDLEREEVLRAGGDEDDEEDFEDQDEDAIDEDDEA